MAQNNGKFVCYYRVSTGRQGKSGLCLEAQREAVKQYLNGGDWEIVAEHTEVESGKNSDRPALEKALADARLHRASLVVSKVDRLTRSVAFLSRLLEAGVDVRFAGLAQIEGGRPISPPLYRRATGGWRQDPKSHRRQPERTPHPDSAGRRPMVGGAGQARAGSVVGDGTRAGLVRCQKPFRRLSGGNDED
jgi:hypothetical protein